MFAGNTKQFVPAGDMASTSTAVLAWQGSRDSRHSSPQNGQDHGAPGQQQSDSEVQQRLLVTPDVLLSGQAAAGDNGSRRTSSRGNGSPVAQRRRRWPSHSHCTRAGPF